MRFVIFTHSLLSDWNHGNAHFLRGTATELMARGHDVRIFEPREGWSLSNLRLLHGEEPIAAFKAAYPQIDSHQYDSDALDIPSALSGADVVLVHEWNSHDLIARLGEYHEANNTFRLFFHDTHHRSITDAESLASYDLRHYDGVLAYGKVIRDIYRANNWVRDAWTWHEAADTRVFRPIPDTPKTGDLVWIGNWGDGERSEEIRRYLIEPVKTLKLKAKVYGVRYPDHALKQLDAAGIEYGGWLANFRVPHVFAQHRVTVHIPRRPYATALPGIPTIRPFEALACGIPLVTAPWEDAEDLFRPGIDFLTAGTGEEMIAQLERVLSQPELAGGLARNGLATIHARHTCRHRVDELISIVTAPNRLAVAEGVH